MIPLSYYAAFLVLRALRLFASLLVWIGKQIDKPRIRREFKKIDDQMPSVAPRYKKY